MFDVVEASTFAKPTRGLADPLPLVELAWVEVEELEEATEEVPPLPYLESPIRHQIAFVA
jgi:hypothetical protein